MIKGAFYMKEKQDTTKEQTEVKGRSEQAQRKERIKVRLIPIWLRVVLVIFLSALSLFIGVIFGYGVIGDGHPKDVFKKSTWTQIIDLVNKEK